MRAHGRMETTSIRLAGHILLGADVRWIDTNVDVRYSDGWHGLYVFASAGQASRTLRRAKALVDDLTPSDSSA